VKNGRNEMDVFSPLGQQPLLIEFLGALVFVVTVCFVESGRTYKLSVGLNLLALAYQLIAGLDVIVVPLLLIYVTERTSCIAQEVMVR
jgi:hypothetical protein